MLATHKMTAWVGSGEVCSTKKAINDVVLWIRTD